MSVRSTTKRLDLFMPIYKTTANKYLAVLSDDSIDREDEIMDEAVLIKAAKEKKVLPALLDHKNEVLSMVGQWKNKRVQKIKGHNALIAEISWFKSNPNSAIVKGMIDEGAQMGVSIGAIPLDHTIKSINGKSYKTYTDLEIVEGSFTPVPANRNAQFLALAKTFKLDTEVNFMENIEKREQFPETDAAGNQRMVGDGHATGQYGEDKNRIMDEVMHGVKAAVADLINQVSEYKAVTADLKKTITELQSTRKAQLQALRKNENGEGEVSGDGVAELEKPKPEEAQKEESAQAEVEQKSYSELLAAIQK